MEQYREYNAHNRRYEGAHHVDEGNLLECETSLEMAGRDCSESSHKETCGHNPQEWGQALLSEKCLDHRSGNRDDHKEQRCEKERQAKDGV